MLRSWVEILMFRLCADGLFYFGNGSWFQNSFATFQDLEETLRQADSGFETSELSESDSHIPFKNGDEVLIDQPLLSNCQSRIFQFTFYFLGPVFEFQKLLQTCQENQESLVL